MRTTWCFFISLFFCISAWASGPDCLPGQTGYVKKGDVTDYGLFRGRFMCKALYWDQTQSYITGVAQGPLYYQELNTSNDLKSCQAIEDLNQLRWGEFKDYGLPVAVDIHFLNKAKLDSDCQPQEIVGFACSFSFKFKDSILIFHSKIYDEENQNGKCLDILNSMVVRK